MKTKLSKEKLYFPGTILVPVRLFLQNQLKNLEKRRKSIEEEDPFRNSERVSDNALDTEAEEQFGHARTSAIREQIDRRIIQTRKALSRLKIGHYGICEACGNMIDTDRLMIYPDATRCVNCEKKR